MQRENICDSLAFAYIVDLCLFLYCRFFNAKDKNM